MTALPALEPSRATAAGDTLDDLFPGSGAVSRAWAAFTATADPSHVARADASRLSATNATRRADPGDASAEVLP